MFNVNKKTILYLVISLILLLFASNSTFALDLFSPEAAKGLAKGEGDLLIKYIIKPLYETEDSATSVIAVSKIFLQGLLVLGGIIFIYNTVVGLTNTALVGEIMGKKFSTTYTVARNVVGVGMLIPLGGFATIQYITLWLAAQGVLLGDVAWESFVDNKPLSSQIILNNSIKNNFIESLQPIIMSNVCVAHMREVVEEAKKDPKDPTKLNKVIGAIGNGNLYTSWTVNKAEYEGFTNIEKEYASKTIKQIKDRINAGNTSLNNTSQLDSVKMLRARQSNVYNFGLSAAEAKNSEDMKSFCGKINLVTQKSPLGDNYTGLNDDTRNSNVSLGYGNIKTFKALSNVVDLDEKKLIFDEKIRETYDPYIRGVKDGKVDKIVEKIIASIKDETVDTNNLIVDIAKLMMEAADEYFNKIKKIGKDLTQQNQMDPNSIKYMKEDGMAAAGAWYWVLVSQGSNLSDLLNNPPIFQSNSEEIHKNLLHNSIAQNAKIKGKGLDTTLLRADYLLKQALWLLSDGDAIQSDGLSIKGSVQNIDDKYLNFLQKFTGEKVAPIGKIDFIQKTDENPVITVHTLGKKILYWIQNVIDKLIGGEMSQMGVFGSFATILVLGLLMPAVTMVYYIPLLPFILWMGSLIGWIVLVAQALFGTPLWMLAHLMPDKESFVGRQGQGYMLILSLFLRPILMVIGYVFSLQLLIPVGKLINAFFGFTALTVLGGTNLIWLIGVFAVTGIYAMVMQNTVKKIFSLIHVFPDSLLQWFGGQDQKILGEYANGIEQGSTQGVAQLGGALSGATNSLAYRMNAGGGMAGGIKGAGGSVGSVGGAPHSTSDDLKKAIGIFGADNQRINDAIDNGTQPGAKNIDSLFRQLNEGKDVGVNTNIQGSPITGGVPLTQTQEGEIRRSAANMQNDFNAYSNLSAAQKDMIRKSGATNFTRGGKTYAVPPENMANPTYNSSTSIDEAFRLSEIRNQQLSGKNIRLK